MQQILNRMSPDELKSLFQRLLHDTFAPTSVLLLVNRERMQFLISDLPDATLLQIYHSMTNQQQPLFLTKLNNHQASLLHRLIQQETPEARQRRPAGTFSIDNPPQHLMNAFRGAGLIMEDGQPLRARQPRPVSPSHGSSAMSHFSIRPL